tara:strand:- start:82 stop:381 length:300 start_codon:yes stop_codon:yes gene_type:complete
MSIYKSVAADATNFDLTTPGKVMSKPKEIYISNTSANVLTATLNITDANNNVKANLINTVDVPVGSVLILESKAVGFNTRIHKLRITTTGSATCSVIIS